MGPVLLLSGPPGVSCLTQWLSNSGGSPDPGPLERESKYLQHKNASYTFIAKIRHFCVCFAAELHLIMFIIEQNVKFTLLSIWSVMTAGV